MNNETTIHPVAHHSSSAGSSDQATEITHGGYMQPHNPEALAAAKAKLEGNAEINENHPLWEELAPKDSFVGDTYWVSGGAGLTNFHTWPYR